MYTHIYLHMYTYLCVCSICLYLCSPFLFDFGYWHLGSKSFEGTWMDRQLLSDWAATGFSQCLGGIKWSFMEILIQILQGFHPGNHPGIYFEHGIGTCLLRKTQLEVAPPNWKFGKLWSSQPGHARWLWWFQNSLGQSHGSTRSIDKIAASAVWVLGNRVGDGGPGNGSDPSDVFRMWPSDGDLPSVLSGGKRVDSQDYHKTWGFR